jgi:uncharacterized membrane protein
LKSERAVRQISKMEKDDLFEMVLTYMDSLFDDTLSNLDESTVEKVANALISLILLDKRKKLKEKDDQLNFKELEKLLKSPSASKIVSYFSKKENAFLFASFFLLE